jgi:hypothetical protein
LERLLSPGGSHPYSTRISGVPPAPRLTP